jgi:hypothetical protein
MKLGRLTLRELALLAGDHLRRRGVDAVLTGEACVSIYTRNRFLSYDLDFVLAAAEDRASGAEALTELGFRKEGRHFRHPDIPFLVEFLSPPLSIGGDPVRHVAELRKGEKVLRLLSPTDCVKDRLAAFYFWNDRPSLEQALLVARRHAVDMNDIRRWSLREGREDRFAIFRRMREKNEKRKRKLGE